MSTNNRSRVYVQKSFGFFDGDANGDDAQSAGDPAQAAAGQQEHAQQDVSHEAAAAWPDGDTLFSSPRPVPDAEDPTAKWSTLDDLAKAVSSCTACRLRGGCTQVVFGEGDPRSAVMFVGEGPGETEDQLGRPFVGRAGQLLDRILVASGFQREEVYIANIVKCRPPGNRQPASDEAQACLPWLRAQMRLIRPRLVVCLGAAATGILIDPRLRITAARGKWHECQGLRYMPTFHPAALLRDPAKKKPVWEDMKKVRAEYERLRVR